MVAMSGGVDSSVAAALLVEKGYEVIGVTLQIWPSDASNDESKGYKVCCSLAAVEDARRVAAKLGIPHYVLNYKDIFKKAVIDDFRREYEKGRTPNPCIRCNQHIKFEALRNKATAMGIGKIATGHYARIEKDKKTNRFILKKGIDEKKDQSYALYIMTQEQLETTLMPLGELTKKETRKIARDIGLLVAEKPESQEICFVPDGDYVKFITKNNPNSSKPGPIISSAGEILGEHKGIINYTIGQRKGIGISFKKPMYVTEINPDTNTIVVGAEKELYKKSLVVEDLNWISSGKLSKDMHVKAKIRYGAEESSAKISPYNNEEVLVYFDEAQKAPAPGQAVVFYDGDVVVGGGTIERVLKNGR